MNFIDEWWKNSNNVNNNIINSKKCLLSSNNYKDLIQIKRSINLISELKSVDIKEISLNSNLIIINFYGDEEIFKKNLSLKKLLYQFGDNCIIYK